MNNVKPAFEVHHTLKEHLDISDDVCFPKDHYIKIATSHLRNSEKIQTLLQKRVLTQREVLKLIEYPSGIMFLEIGGYVSGKEYHNTTLFSCWKGKSKKPYLNLPAEFKVDWHIHPWNVVGDGRPAFFSLEDIEDASVHKKRKILFAGNPFVYKWPKIFDVDMRNGFENYQDLIELIEILKVCTPFIDPKINWDYWINKLKNFKIQF